MTYLIMQPFELSGGNNANFMREVIEGIRPDVEIAGFTESLDFSDEEAILIICPSWPGILASYDEAPDNLFVMPIPEGDPWSYWSFSRRVREKVGTIRRLSDTELGEVLGPDEAGEAWEQNYLRYYPAFLNKSFNRIAHVMGNLADDESRDLYGRVLTGEPEDLWRGYAAQVFKRPSVL